MVLAGLTIALFLSGLSALIFETLWLQLSGLVFGNSVWAAALILSSFMAGLALGNLLATSDVWRRLRPLRAYALLELAVGLAGCLIVVAMPSLGTALRPLFQALWAHQLTLLALRFILSFVILLVPTTAMGLTLAVLVGDRALEQHKFGGVVGLLYGANSLGAVAGTIICEAWLLRAFGIMGTSIVAAAANTVAALLAFCIAQVCTGGAEDRPRTWKLAAVFRTNARWLTVGFGSGFLLLSLEVIWFRFLRLYVASSTVAFATMLAVVLSGIGLGSLASGVAQRVVGNVQRFVGIFLVFAGLATLLCYIWFPASAAGSVEGPYNLDRWPQVALISLALMFPVSWLSGMLFPAVAALIESSGGERSGSLGLATFVNTLGATAGPLLATFVFLPKLGFQTSLVLVAVAYGALGIVAAIGNRPLLTWCLTAALLIVVALFPYQRDQMHLSHARELYAPEGSYLVKQLHGTADTYQLLRRDLYGEPYYYRLLTNSFSMSATSPFAERYMRLFAYLPRFLNAEAKRALLICYGCGVTADALLRGSQLDHVDAVDIAQEVYDLSPDYRTPDYVDPLTSAKLSHHVQDGRFYLQATPERYDIITGEPPPLKVVGAVNLYTAEFFSLMRSRLNQGGIASFWLPIYQLTPDETKAILRAFHEAFPNSSLWSGTEEEWVMLGINGQRRQVTDAEARRLWDDPATGKDLVGVGFETPAQMAASFLMDSDAIDEYVGGALPLTDNYPRRLTDARADDSVTYRFAWKYVEAAPALRRFTSSSAMQALWPTFSDAELRLFFEFRAAKFLKKMIGSNKMADLDYYLRTTRLRSPVLAALGSDEVRVKIAERVGTLDAVPDLVAGALADRDIAGAVQWLEKKTEAQLTDEEVWLLVYLYCIQGQVSAAEQLATRHAAAFEKNEVAGWLVTKLATEFGFQPPR